MSLLRQKGGPANLSPEVTSLQGGLEPAGAGGIRSAPPARREPQETKEHQSRAQKRYVKFLTYKNYWLWTVTFDPIILAMTATMTYLHTISDIQELRPY